MIFSERPHFNHRLPEGFVADVSIVDAVILLFAASSCKLIRRKIFFASRCFSISVTVWPNVSSTAEMYFLFSAESSDIRCPHVQYIIPALQCLRHALHCNFGSTLIISHSSVFPAAIIATFDSALKGLNGWCCSRSFWIVSFWGWLSICWIKLWTLMLCDRFTIHRKVELIRVIKMFEITIFLHFVPSIGLPRSIGRTKFFLQLTNNLLGNGLPRSIFNGFRELGWFGKTRLKCFSKWLLNEFANWSMFNCRTLIISFTPVKIVLQRDLRWWTRRQVLFFMEFLSISQSFSFHNAICWKCSLKDNCVRSCLIELQSFSDPKINIDPKYRIYWCLFHAFCKYRARRGAE